MDNSLEGLHIVAGMLIFVVGIIMLFSINILIDDMYRLSEKSVYDNYILLSSDTRMEIVYGQSNK